MSPARRRGVQPACLHRGRVRAVVVEVSADGEYPNTVVCGDCSQAISSQAVWWASYDEADDGWYYPIKEKGPARAPLASHVGPSASAEPLPPTSTF